MIEGLKQKLQSEVERLNHEISFVLPKEIEKARAHGDLRENSEYKAALERQQFAQARVHHRGCGCRSSPTCASRISLVTAWVSAHASRWKISTRRSGKS